MCIRKKYRIRVVDVLVGTCQNRTFGYVVERSPNAGCRMIVNQSPKAGRGLVLNWFPNADPVLIVKRLQM